MQCFLILLMLTILPVIALADDPEPKDVAPGEFAGIVVDSQGQPIQGALVDVWTWYPGNETKTNKDGHFHIGHFAEGKTIEVRISKAGYSPWYQTAQGTGGQEVKITLGDKTFLQGIVTAPDGKPIPNALIRADCGPKTLMEGGMRVTNVWTDTRSDADGHYKLFVSPDFYNIQVRVADLGVASAQSQIDADQSVALDIHLETGARFVVHCIDGDTSEPIAGVRINTPAFKGINATSDANGDAVFDHLLSQRYSFYVSGKLYVKSWSADALNQTMRTRPQNLSLPWESLQFDVGADAPPVTVQLEKGVTVSGHVVDPDGKPVARATIATDRCGYDDSIDMTERFTTQTNAKGEFTLTLPASGNDQLNLIAHDGNQNTWHQWANGVTDAMQTKQGENLTDITIKLTTPATIRGQVVDGAGAPIPHKAVRVMSADNRDSRYYAPEAETDKDGNFELKHVRPGDVLVQVEPFYMREPGGQTPAIQSVPVSVEANEVKEGVIITAK